MVEVKDICAKGIFGSVDSRLQFARKLHQDCRSQILSKAKIPSALILLERTAEALSSHMANMRMAEICIRCSEQESGGCCSLYMAGETDAIQLLMNMLVGVDVRPVRDDGAECCYLGNSGCIFVFKPFFCLNYNCREVIEPGGEKNRLVLEKLTGRVLVQQHELEKLLIAEIVGMREG